jgi:hypothetical protein
MMDRRRLLTSVRLKGIFTALLFALAALLAVEAQRPGKGVSNWGDLIRITGDRQFPSSIPTASK